MFASILQPLLANKGERRPATHRQKGGNHYSFASKAKGGVWGAGAGTYSNDSNIACSLNRIGISQGLTKRCRLYLLTNSALVFEPEWGEGGGELRGLSQWVQLYTGAQINFGDLTPYLNYGISPHPHTLLHRDFWHLLASAVNSYRRVKRQRGR